MPRHDDHCFYLEDLGMLYVLIVIGVILAFVMSALLAQSIRNIEYINKQQDVVLETAKAEAKRVDDRLTKTVNVINNNTDIYDADFRKIFDRLDEIAADIKRLDEIDARSQRAIHQANEIANRYVLYREPKEDPADDNSEQ